MFKPTRPRLGQFFALVSVLAASSIAAVAQDKAPTPAKPAAAAKKPSIYDKSADAQVQVDKATVEARREDKRILVMFGGDWCGWCHKLHELFASDAEVRKILSYEYVLVMVDTEAPNAVALLSKCKAALSKEELQKGVGYRRASVIS
jgi:thioredoxin-related protein